MSYILDALKKSQGERELGKIPTLDSLQEVATTRRHENRRWWISLLAGAVLAGAVLVGAGAVATRLLWLPESALPAEAGEAGLASPSAGPELTAVAADQNPPALAPGQSEIRPPMPTRPAPPAIADEPAPAELPPGFFGYTRIEPGMRHMAKPLSGEPASAPAAGPGTVVHAETPLVEPAFAPEPDYSQVPMLAEMPEEYQRSVPALSLSVHVYAQDPAGRFAFVNGVKYRQGETTQEGPVVEAITATGLVLSYQGQRFRLRL